MSFCRTHTWGRRTGAALLAVTFAAPSAFGQADVGVVFVGDINPAAAAAGPKLPALTPTARSGDTRYGNDSRLTLRQTPVPSSVPSSVVRAEYAQRIGDKIREAEESQKKPSLLSRLMPGFGRKESAPAMSVPTPAAAQPVPTLPAEFTRGVQQASFAERGSYDEYSGRVGGIIDTPGARQHTGLFDSNRLPSGSKPSNSNKPSANASRNRKQLSQSNSPKPSAPKQLAAAPAAKKLPPAEPTGDGMAFAGDRQQPAPGARLPRPSLVPESLQTPAVGPSTPIIRSVGQEQPRLTPVEPSPIVVTNPAAMPPSMPNAANGPELADSKPAPQPSYPVTNPAATPTPAEGPSESVVATNPVPPTKIEQGPSPRAAGLLVEANGYAQTAATEEEFSNVIQRCRHVLAIDNSPAAVKYSRDLAAWALNKRGELKADAGQDKEAMTDFDDALAMDPLRWRAVHNRGVLLAQHGAFAEAFDAFNETLDLNPKFAKAYSNRASLYVQAGDFENAMRDYASAIANDPDLAIAHKGQGRVCHMLGRMELALRHLDAASVLAPEDASAAVCRADLLVDMGRYAAALSGYQQAIELDGESPAAYRNLAWLQATCPDKRFVNTREAIANAKRAIELSGAEDDISLDTLAAAQAASGDFAAAVETLRRAISLAPAGDQEVYAERLVIYQAGRPFTSEPVAEVQQAGYDRVFR